MREGTLGALEDGAPGRGRASAKVPGKREGPGAFESWELGEGECPERRPERGDQAPRPWRAMRPQWRMGGNFGTVRREGEGKVFCCTLFPQCKVGPF